MPSNYYLRIGGSNASPEVPGDAQDLSHKNWIEIESWSFSISNASDPGRGTRATKSVASFSEFSFTKLADKGSPKLFFTICNGQPIKELVFAGKKAGGALGQIQKNDYDYLIVTFENCIISSFSQSGGGDGEVMPSEHVSFAFQTVRFQQFMIDTQGRRTPGLAFSYDTKENRKV